MSEYSRDHWHRIAVSQPRVTWLDRSEIASRFIRPGDVVLDLGAGAQTLRKFLPSSVGYIPVDHVKAHPDTWVADFDGDYELPDEPFNVVTCLGLFSHLKNPTALLERLAFDYPGRFIIYTTNLTEPQPDFPRFVSDICVVTMLRNVQIVTGVLNMPGASRPQNRALRDVICSHTTLGDYVASRWALFRKKRKRGGNNGQAVLNSPAS